MNTFATFRMRRPPCRRHPQRGSVLIEFLIVFPIVMAMLLIVADFGRLTPWAQQMAYSADAGAQFAYQSYSCDGDEYRRDRDENGEPGGPVGFSVIEGEIKEHVESVIKGFGIDDEFVKIEVKQIWRCREPSFDNSSLTMEVKYGEEIEGRDRPNCSAPDEDEPARFIDVEVTAKFVPFSPFIGKIVSENEKLFTETFLIRRQIFPAS
ncbi:MAG: TadE/TadG family type IV pilus assembly protein [Halochromatium sp.]